MKDKLPVPLTCNLCRGPVVKRSNAVVYGCEFGRWPFIYLCLKCGAYVGLHPKTDFPLGTLADADTRAARRVCKPFFEKIWKEKLLSRSKAYEELAKRMEIDKRGCHFAMFDSYQAKLAKQISIQIYKELKKEYLIMATLAKGARNNRT